ncbi:hypothetical protein B0T25DRAFT_565954 [Lasiosphaeria hispida]|uniref:Uncharacterized protein n=1 Tax=Lasiosphaeria hispida TaxID=260671 RepID=A0AAJ0MFD1_9PEZI|nr:hypothetical protein B0T25DRAFT_565954 [Lasiosphaeria hispida]
MPERRWELYQWSQEKIPADFSAKGNTEWLNPQYQAIFKRQRYGLYSAVLAITILMIPWGLAFAWLHSSPWVRKRARKRIQFLRLGPIRGLYYLVGVIAFCVAIGGTVMQLLGVYRNCVCKAGLFWGLPTTHYSRGTAQVKLSTDTQMDRDQSWTWMTLGVSGVVWLVVLCTVAAGTASR